MKTRLVALAVAFLAVAHPAGAAPVPRAAIPFAKLDPDELTRIERALLPDIAVAVATIPDGMVLSCAFSSDGKMATGSDRGAVYLWDMNGAKPRFIDKLVPEDAEKVPVPLPAAKTTEEVFKHRADRVAFSPDGTRLAVSLGFTLYVWEVGEKGGKLVDSKKVGRIEGMAFSPDGNTIVCGANLGQRFAVGAKKLEALPGTFTGAQGEYTFSKDGLLFASVFFSPERNGPLYGSEVMVWKPEKEKPVDFDLLTLESGIKAIDFSPDRKRMATGSLDKKVSLWDLTGKKSEVKATAEAPKWIRKLAFTPDGDALIAFSSGCDIILYDGKTAEKRKSWEFTARRNTEFQSQSSFFTATAVAPDGKHIAFSNGNAKTVILRLPGKDEAKK